MLILCSALGSIQCIGQSSEEIICFFPPQPEFPGGMDSLRTYILLNLEFPAGDIDHSGKVFVGFIVNEDGCVSNVEIVKGLCGQCDHNALEVFKMMPKWTPAMNGNAPTKTRMTIPVFFSCEP
jgi:protein TonB